MNAKCRCNANSLSAVCAAVGEGGLSDFIATRPVPDYDACTIPGMIPEGCSQPRVFSNKVDIAAGDSLDLTIPAIQKLMLVSILSRSAVGLGVVIDDISIAGYSFLARLDETKLGADTTDGGLGDIDFLTAELAQSDWPTVPTSDYFNSQYPLTVRIRNTSTVLVAAGAVSLALRLSNMEEVYNPGAMAFPQLINTPQSGETRPKHYDDVMGKMIAAAKASAAAAARRVARVSGAVEFK